jgi:hypothetical protein
MRRDRYVRPRADDKTAKFDEKPRPLSALDLPLAHVTCALAA